MDILSKILLIEDDENLGEVLKEFLRLKGYSIELAQDGEAGMKSFQNGLFDLIILDIMLPKIDGFTFLENIKTQNSKIPVIILTAKNMQQDKLKGLKLGADDYITKPFNTDELLLRINNILRRTNNNTFIVDKSNTKYKLGKYTFDYSKQCLIRNNQTIKLTSKENELLLLLTLNRNEILERSNALKHIWGEESYFTGRSMDVYILKLRKYLKHDQSLQILNVHGKGFKLID